MGIKIKYELCDQSYINKIVKNSENGRKYLQIMCPSCRQTFDKKDFYNHVVNTHWRNKDEVLARLFCHKQYPVICPDCGNQVKFDEYSGTYPKRCRTCLTKEKQAGLGIKVSNEDTIDELRDKLAKLDEEHQMKRSELLQQIKAKEREDKWKNLDIKSMNPIFTSESAWFVRKVSYELRTHIVNGISERQPALELLNFIDSYIDSEKWNKEEVTENSNKEVSSD